jgi:hypothetical protein
MFAKAGLYACQTLILTGDRWGSCQLHDQFPCTVKHQPLVWTLDQIKCQKAVLKLKP